MKAFEFGIIVLFTTICSESVFGIGLQVNDICKLYLTISASDLVNENATADDWMCIISEDTNFTYTLVKNYKPVGPRFGLWQTQSPTWCIIDGQDSNLKNYCNINCNAFLDDSLDDDIKCVSRIFHLYGLDYWKIWKDNCRGRQIPNYSYCEDGPF